MAVAARRSGAAPGVPDRHVWVLQRLDDEGHPRGDPFPVDGESGLAAAVADVERRDSPRWVWADTSRFYPSLLRAGVRVARTHDVSLTEALLVGHAGAAGAPHSLTAAWARLTGLEIPLDPARAALAPDHAHDQPALFAADSSPMAGGAPPADDLEVLLAVHAAQLAAVAAAGSTSPGFGLLVAAESAAGLAAGEMGAVGMPWRADIHDGLLEAALGERPPLGGRPPKLQALAEEVAAALDSPGLNPDSQPDLLRACRMAGLPLRTTRAWELKQQQHPAVEPLLRYKELARLHAAHGWAWRRQWVREGRFHPEYVPGGVVSGRWATRGGGALQIPRAVRGAVVADEGWVLVLADAGQLEPRVLAALSGDDRMVAATREGDLYAAVAAEALGGTGARAEAKVALLSAMYGGGTASPALAALRHRFPEALALLEDAARAGEDGALVRSALGRTCPPPHPGWQDGPEPAAVARARARGRFTRNFVVQASAADWANVLVAGLRTRLAAAARGDERADLVFFQHDEVMVHAPQSLAEAAVEAVAQAGADATRLVLGERGVHVPLTAQVATTYAQK